ncbi:DUF2079 domain-containing protein [Cuniculiplasma sp. SKW4]
MRMYSMIDGVFDAGIISLTLNSILFNHSWAYLEYMFGFSLLRILFSPLILIYGIPGMLIIQEFFLGTPALILYKIGILKTGDRTSSLLFAISYLIYFPLAGVNYFDYHFQAFFMFFFLLGYYMYLKERYLLSSVFFFLSGSVRFPYFFFPYLFIVFIMIEEILRRRNRQKDHNLKMKYILANFLIFSLMLIISALVIFRSPYYLYQERYFSGYFHISSTNFVSTLFTNVDNKVINVVLIFSPLLFIPFRSPKWLLFLIPFASLSMFNLAGIYTYPYFYHTQYTVTVVPFIYIALIEGARIHDHYSEQEEKIINDKTRHRMKHLIIEMKKRKEPITVLAVVFLFAIVFQPYSPINAYSSDPFSMNIFHPNLQQYNDYVNVVNLIPRNDPYVIYQYQLPYVDVHDYDLSCLEAFDTVYGYGPNDTYILQNLSTTNRVDYAIGYYDGFSSSSGVTMCEAMNYLVSKGDYGIEAYESGIVLLTRNYNAAPRYYIPLNLQGNGTLFNNSGNRELIIPYSMIIPGIYNITFSFPYSINMSALGTLGMGIRGLETSYDNLNFTSVYNNHNLTLTFTLKYFYGQGNIDVFFSNFKENFKVGYDLNGEKRYKN